MDHSHFHAFSCLPRKMADLACVQSDEIFTPSLSLPFQFQSSTTPVSLSISFLSPMNGGAKGSFRRSQTQANKCFRRPHLAPIPQKASHSTFDGALFGHFRVMRKLDVYGGAYISDEWNRSISFPAVHQGARPTELLEWSTTEQKNWVE